MHQAKANRLTRTSDQTPDPTALVKAFFQPKSADMFSYFSKKNICSGYSLEAPRRGASNEYPQHMFSWKNKKNVYSDTILSP